MKLAFSTLGCPVWSLDKVITMASSYGFQGVELRGINSTLDIRQTPEFSGERIARTRQSFENAGIDIVSVDSSASLSWRENDKITQHREEAKDYITLAGKLGAPLVRVFGGFIPSGVTPANAVNYLADNLSQLGDFAQSTGEKNIFVALETHDSFLIGEMVSAVMKTTNHRSVGVIWDVSNCFWTGEPIEKTAELLMPYLKLVHIKDSVWDGKKARLTFVGDGDVPIPNVLKVLAKYGYQGYISYEWEKVWQPDIPEPEQAFPQYVKMIKKYLGVTPV